MRPATRLRWAIAAAALLAPGCRCSHSSPLPAARELARVCAPRDVAADRTHLYLACRDAIERVPLRGGAPGVVAQDRDGPVRVAVQGDRVYWTTRTPDARLKSAPKTGGAVERLPIRAHAPRSPMLTDESGLYLVTLDGGHPWLALENDPWRPMLRSVALTPPAR